MRSRNFKSRAMRVDFNYSGRAYFDPAMYGGYTLHAMEKRQPHYGCQSKLPEQGERLAMGAPFVEKG